MAFDSSIRLRQLNNPEVSGYVVSVIENYLTGNISLPPTGILSGIFYPLNLNPSGYISSGATGIFMVQSNLNSLYYQLVTYVGQNYYPTSNPQNYVLSGQTGSFVTLNQTGAFASVVNLSTTGNTLNSLINLFSGIVIENYITTGQTGQFYPANNPSGFIIPSQTGAFYASNNPLSYIRSGSNAVLNSLLISGIDNAFYSFSITTGNVNPNSQSSITNNSVFNIDNLGNVYLLPSSTIEFSDAGGIAFINGNMVLSDNYNEGVLLSQITGLSTGLQTEINNLSGTLTGNYVKLSQTGNFYASNNPAGYITGLNTGSFVTTGQTGSFGANTGQLTSVFYPLTGNPSGFILPSQTGVFATATNLNSTGSYLLGLLSADGVVSINSQGGALSLAGAGNVTVSNIGTVFIVSGNTGSFVSIGQTGNFASSVNLSTTGNYLTNLISSGNLTGNFVDSLNITGLNLTGNITLSGIGGLGLTTSGQTIFISGGGSAGNTIQSGSGSYIFRTFLTSGNTGQYISFPSILDTGARVIMSNPSNGPSIIPAEVSGISSGGFWAVFSNAIDNTGYFVDTIASISTNTGLATTIIINNYTTSGGSGSLFQITGSNYITGTNFTGVGSVTVSISGGYTVFSDIPNSYVNTSQTGAFLAVNLTGQFYASNNPAGYITGFNSGNYVQTGSTGNFIVTSQTGAFYAINNPSGFITGLNTGSFITTGQTGQFYPLIGNPSSFILTSQTGAFASVVNLSTSGNILTNLINSLSGTVTGNYVLTGNTGNFIITSQTGNFASSTNLSTTGNILTNSISSLSGTLTGNYILNSQSGIFVSATGIQNISGRKTFDGDLVVSGVGSPERAFFSQKNNTEFVWGLNVDSNNADALDISTDSAFKFGMMTTNQQGGGYNGLHFQTLQSGLGSWSNSKTVWTIDVSGDMFCSGNITGGAYYSGNTNLASIFINTGQTGQFYAVNNPSGYITGINTGNFASTLSLFNTGNILNSLVNSLSGILTGGYVTTGQTGSFGGSFNTGTLVGTFALSNQTGNFLTSGIIPYGTLTSGATGYFTINFSGNPNQQINLVNTGTYTVTGSNYPSSGYVSDVIVFLYNTATGNSVVNFPSGWINVGGGWPTGIVSGKSATMWLRAIDNTGMVIGSYNTQL